MKQNKTRRSFDNKKAFKTVSPAHSEGDERSGTGVPLCFPHDADAMLQNHVGYLRNLLERGGPRPDEYSKMDAWVATLYSGIDAGVYPVESLNHVRNLFEPLLTLNTMHGWAWTKPHGYPGDFEIIDRFYLNYVVADPAVASWDQYWQACSAAKAVRNRKAYFHRVLYELEKAANGKALAVLNVASGPGRDVSEYLQKSAGNIHFECIDHDANAIAHASNLCRQHSQRVMFRKANVLKFCPEKQYDIVWSAGLFDYFSDRTFKQMLRRFLPAVIPGGQLVIGNFSVENPSHLWLDFCDWHLNHRTKEQLEALAIEAGASRESVFVGKEPEGVNLFLHIKRPVVAT